MVKMKQVLMYGIPLVAGGALVYYLATKSVAPAAAAPAGQMQAAPQGDLVSMASQQLGIPASELVVRGLRPEDCGLTTSWNFTSTVANTWENWVTHTVADNTFISIQGVSYGGTNFAQARIQAGARYSGYWNLSFISGLVSQLYYEPQPIIIQQNQTIIIDVISKAAATESINLMGTVVQRRGLVVNP